MRDLPGLLTVAVLAFAQFERRPLLAALGLYRGLAVQLAYRWGSGQVLARDRRAVLMWSEPGRVGRPGLRRQLRGVSTGVAIGTLQLLAGTLLLLLPLGELLDTLGLPTRRKSLILLAVVLGRLGLTGWRAAGAYRLTAARQAAFPELAGRCWRIDYLAAAPLGAGHGGRLLDRFVQRADRAGATVVLITDERNRAFYRRHGFRLHPAITPALGANLLMVRDAGQIRAARGRRPAARS